MPEVERVALDAAELPLAAELIADRALSNVVSDPVGVIPASVVVLTTPFVESEDAGDPELDDAALADEGGSEDVSDSTGLSDDPDIPSKLQSIEHS